jgi:hypothetical protein
MTATALIDNFKSDTFYVPGSVVVFGGDKEVTATTWSHDARVAGVVSGELTEEGLPVMLNGRVRCQVIGPVSKGDLLVTSRLAGVAQRMIEESYKPGCVLGKALENLHVNNVEVIEIVVGQF